MPISERKIMQQISSKLKNYPERSKSRLFLKQTRPIISPIRPSFTSTQRVIEGCGQYFIESTVMLHQIIVVQLLNFITIGVSAAFLHRENLRLILMSEGFLD